MCDCLRTERFGGVIQVVMNNPPAHTWTDKSLSAFKKLIDKIDADRSVQALVLTGDGDKFFSAGADLKIFAEAGSAQALKMARLFSDAFEALSQFRGVSIAAINGYAMGGGLEAALACDIRIAANKAKMGLPEAKVGLLPCAGGTQNLTALVGEGWAKRIILCAETVDADKALSIGLVEQVVPQEKVVTTALELAQSATKQSPSSIERCKRLIQAGRHQPRWQGLMMERELFIELWNNDNREEGCRAFLEKREPNWS